jgi:hypothetical protein
VLWEKEESDNFYLIDVPHNRQWLIIYSNSSEPSRIIVKASAMAERLAFMADLCFLRSFCCDLGRCLEEIFLFTDGRESSLRLGSTLSLMGAAAARGEDGTFDDDLSPSFSFLDDFFSSDFLLDFFFFSVLYFRGKESLDEQPRAEAVASLSGAQVGWRFVAGLLGLVESVILAERFALCDGTGFESSSLLSSSMQRFGITGI